MERCGSRPGASRYAMRMTPPRLGWAPAWARAGVAAASKARTSALRTTAARYRRDGKGSRRAMARPPVLEFVVIDRETGAKWAEKLAYLALGARGCQCVAASRSDFVWLISLNLSGPACPVHQGLAGCTQAKRSPSNRPSSSWARRVAH